MQRRRPNLTIGPIAITLLALGLTGCGSFVQPLPDATPNFNLEALREIQNDERLTDDERRQQIRDLVGAPNTPEGDRLVEFLLTLP